MSQWLASWVLRRRNNYCLIMAAYVRDVHFGAAFWYCRLPDITGSLLWLPVQNCVAALALSFQQWQPPKWWYMAHTPHVSAPPCSNHQTKQATKRDSWSHSIGYFSPIFPGIVIISLGTIDLFQLKTKLTFHASGFYQCSSQATKKKTQSLPSESLKSLTGCIFHSFG